MSAEPIKTRFVVNARLISSVRTRIPGRVTANAEEKVGWTTLTMMTMAAVTPTA
jgi:hypothetical protein